MGHIRQQGNKLTGPIQRPNRRGAPPTGIPEESQLCLFWFEKQLLDRESMLTESPGGGNFFLEEHYCEIH